METEDVTDIPTSDASRSVGENNNIMYDDPSSFSVDMTTDEAILGQKECDLQHDNGHSSPETEWCSNLVNSSSIQSNNGTKLGHNECENQLVESNPLPESIVQGSSEVQAKVEVLDSLTVAQQSLHTSSEARAGDALSGKKRARMTFEEQQPAVHVSYNFLTRASKRKLEELLLQWSEWHALHDSASLDPAELTESGEEKYFPALHTGLQTSCAVSFWMDSQQRKEQERGLISSDAKSVPLYDRTYAKGLISSDGSTYMEGLQLSDDPARCFNCGSYSHSLKECIKPRDNVAVKNAREQFKSKRNQSSASRNPTRYYQNTPGGKYEGLRPGALDPETRKLLGIGELDPPPWLSRMREIGYPPGYLDLDDEDQPSGILIYDGEMMEEQEDGEILEVSSPKKQVKMMVEFPGVNSPIPENADKRLWDTGSSSFDSTRDHSRRRFHYSFDSSSRGHYRERSSWESRNEGPPGCDAVISASAYSYPPRYDTYMSSHQSYDSKDDISRGRSPPFKRASYDAFRRSPLRYDAFLSHGYVRSSSPNKHSHQDHYESARYEDQLEERRAHHNSDYPLYGGEDRHDRCRRHHHHLE